MLSLSFRNNCKAGVHVRRNNKHKQKARVNRDDARTSTSARSFFLRLCLRCPGSRVAYACAYALPCVVRVNQPLQFTLAEVKYSLCFTEKALAFTNSCCGDITCNSFLFLGIYRRWEDCSPKTWIALWKRLQPLATKNVSQRRGERYQTFSELAHFHIRKTRGTLGPNQYRNAAWDRLEGQDSSEDKQKCRGSTIAVYLAAPTATIVVVRHFCLEFLHVLSLQTIPRAFAVLILTQFPTRFGNGLMRRQEIKWKTTRLWSLHPHRSARLLVAVKKLKGEFYSYGLIKKVFLYILFLFSVSVWFFFMCVGFFFTSGSPFLDIYSNLFS